jgi:quercetin dioxygenase-like cupin family protein
MNSFIFLINKKILKVKKMSIRIRKISEEPGIDEETEGFCGVNSVWVVLKRTEIDSFSSRIFRMDTGGHTAMHSHEREHIAIVIRGTCRIESEGSYRDSDAGSIITVPPKISHRFSNPIGDRLVLLIMNLFPE